MMSLMMSDTPGDVEAGVVPHSASAAQVINRDVTSGAMLSRQRRPRIVFHRQIAKGVVLVGRGIRSHDLLHPPAFAVITVALELGG